MNTILRSIAAITLAIGLSTCAFDEPSNSTTTSVPPFYNWSPQNSQSTAKLNDVFFIDGSHGWAVGESLTILATTNGGDNWPQAPSTSILRNLNSVFFVDNQTGWMTSGSDANPVDGHVFISKMGGAYPTQQDMVARPLNAIFFLNKNTGWAAGDSSILIRTDDGGVSWTGGAIGAKNKIFDIHFFTGEMGWAATSQGGIYRTKDGATWTKEDLGVTSDVRAIHFVDTLHGWACGAENKIFRREPDSNNKLVWTTSTISSEPVPAVWRDIFFVDQKTGWIVGSQGKVYKTVDSGSTWKQETTGAHSEFNAIFMVSGSKGWIVGDDGNILTYTP